MPDTATTSFDGIEFLRGGGLVAGRIARHDWSAHPLGPPARWPPELKTVLSIMLGSRFAMCVGWGPDLLLFYNDPYMQVLGAKEPTALGEPIREVWSELWEDIRPLAETATVLQVARTPKATIPVTWTNTYKGGRMLYSSLGAVDDFKDEQFRRFLVNALFWASQRDPDKLQK